MDNQELDPKKVDKALRDAQETPLLSDIDSPIAIKAAGPAERRLKEEEMVNRLVGWHNSWEATRRPRETMWQEIYRMYFTTPEKRRVASRSSLTLAMVFQLIEAAVPKIVNTLFASGESFFEVKPVDAEDPDHISVARKIQRLLKVQLDKIKFFVKFLSFTKQLLLYGTSYLFIHWKVRRDWVWERVPKRVPRTVLGIPIGVDIEWEETKQYRVVERRPEVEVIDILDVIPDPNAAEVSEGKGVFIRSYIDINDLRELGQGKYPVYENTEDETLRGGANSDTSRGEREAARGVMGSSDKKGQVELITFWGKYDVDGDGIQEEAQIVIANRSVLLKATANPFHHQKRPLLKGTLYPVPGEWYGIGLIEPVIGQVHELQTLRRQRIDNINLVLNRMWKVNTFAEVELDTLISAPNNIVLTDQMDGVVPLETNDVTGNAYNEAAAVQQDIERATVPPSAQGVPTGGQLGRTARGAQLIIGQALEKFGTATKLIEDVVLRDMLIMIHQLNLQFIDDDMILQDQVLYGDIAQMEMTPEDIRGSIRFQMIGISEMVGSEGKINQLIAFKQTFMDVLAPETNLALAQKVYELMGFNKQEIQPPPPPDPLKMTGGDEGDAPPAGAAEGVAGQMMNQGGSAARPSLPGVPNT